MADLDSQTQEAPVGTGSGNKELSASSSQSTQPSQIDSPLIQKATKWIDVLSKGGPLAFVVIYVFGYLTLSLYYSSLGMTEISAIKPRIVSAGLLYLLLVTAPISTAIRVMARVDSVLEPFPEKDSVRLLWRLAEVVLGALLFGFMLRRIFVFDYSQDSSSENRLWVLFIAHALISSLGLAFAGLRSKMLGPLKTIFCWILILLIGCDAYVLVPWKGGFRAPQLVLFMVGASCLGVFTRSVLRDPVKRQSVDWFYQLAQLIGPLAIFPFYIYPHIKAEWGGGYPTKGIIIFSKDSVVMPLRPASVSIVEESDSGISILIKGRKKATFIPKSSVGAIFYSDEHLDPNLLDSGQTKTSPR